jgi:DNA polymerase-3 subunit epsilon
MFGDQNLTIVDVETTGGSPFFNRVIELGLLRVEKGEVVEEYQTLLNPDMPIPEFITNMTGISDAAVAKAPRFEEVADDILSKFEGNIFVAHNSQFDYGFLKEEFRRLGYGFVLPQLCTVRLSRALYKEYKHHNLTAIIERYEFECKNRHRAFDDAKVLWDFLQHASADIDSEEFQKAFKQVLKKPRVPKPKIIESENDSEEIFTIS